MGRVIFAVIAVAALGIAVVAVWRTRFLWMPLPDPAVADTTGLVRWLVLRDLSAEPPSVQVQLVSRVEQLLDEPQSATVAATTDIPTAQLAQGQLEQAQRNVELLKELWFERAVDRFHALNEPRRRWAFLDRQIERIDRWMQWDDHLANGGSGGSAGPGSWGGFFAAIERWAAKASPVIQARIWSAVKAGLIRWLGTSEVSRQSEEARTNLALEIEKQLTEPLELSDATDGFSPGEEARFWRNVERLAESWYRYQARQHALASPREQARLVQRHLRLIEQFSPYLDRLPSSKKTSTTEAATAAGFATQVERWIERAPADEQPAMRRLAQHLAGATLLRSFQSLWRRG